MKKPFFITTPIYYANGAAHIGHAYTTIAADVLARAKRLSQNDVIFSVGTDEHGAKIAEKAEEQNQSPQAFVDAVAEDFQALWEKLHISHDAFIRTTNTFHVDAVRNVLATLYKQGAIYKGTYKGLYCVGCEQFKNESDLIDGKCPDHDREVIEMEEESYMLKMTDLQSTLLEKIKTREFHIYPEQYEKEILSFLEGQTLEDVSISRKNVTWGIPLPFDESHTTYVWADAFLNYLTVLGWDGESEVPAAWPADIQLVGKDILRVHATIWPAMLLHLGLPLPKMLYTHGHILSGGKKMSKTLGNNISINEMLERFGADSTRYLLLASGHFSDDVDITMERLVEKYNADLANGLGNLVSRVMKLAENLEALPDFKFVQNEIDANHGLGTRSSYLVAFEEYNLSGALNSVWIDISRANKIVNDNKPWELAKSNPQEFKKIMGELLERLYVIAYLIEPFLPETSEKMRTSLETGKTESLFQRIS